MIKKSFLMYKLNINSNLFTDTVERIINITIPQQILNNPVLELEKFNVSIINQQNLNIDNQDVITGQIVKSRNKFHEIVDYKQRNTEMLLTENEVESKIRFIYLIKDELVLFENNSKFKSKQGAYYFKKLLELEENIGETFIFPIVDKNIFTDEIKKFKVINVIDLEIVHTNIVDKTLFTALDKVIKEDKIKKMKINAVNNEEGMKVEENNIIDMSQEFYENGYGTVSIKGKDFENKHHEYHSKKSTVRVYVELSENDEISVRELTEVIQTAISRRGGKNGL